MESNMLKIPEEVFYGYIFPYFKLNDLLRFRRVCKQLKLYANDFIRNNHSSKDTEVEINETNHTLADFIKLDLPTTRIYLNNGSGSTFFESSEMRDFIQLYCPIITHLRIKIFSPNSSEEETNFFDSLTNLQHLDLETIHLIHDNVVSFQKHGSIPGPGNKFPSHLRQLKTLKFNRIKYTHVDDYRYLMDLINFCPKLEYIRHPRQSGVNTDSEPFDWVKNYIEKRHSENPNEPNLKFYDLLHQQETGTRAVIYFSRFVHLCYQRNVRLMNVNSKLLESVWGSPYVQNSMEWHKYAVPVVSMKNMRRTLFIIEIPNMEKLTITHTSKCTFGLPGIGDLPRWPKLKCLDVTIDSERMDHHGNEPDQILCVEILTFLFAWIPWVSIEEVCMRFAERKHMIGNPVCPGAPGLIATCGRIKRLTLTNWIGTNRAISKLWHGMPNLEEVTLEDCRLLGNVAFVGSNTEKPKFFKLKKLKKLTLSGLELMPKITDLIFDLVFRHLAIKEFYLSSRKPLESITTEGIRSLLTGEFNNSVEKFPFSLWSLKNVSEKEFLELKSEFRASNML